MNARDLYTNDNGKFWQIVAEIDSSELTDDGEPAEIGWIDSLPIDELIERLQNYFEFADENEEDRYDPAGYYSADDR